MSIHPVVSDLIAEIEKFRAVSGMSESAFGKACVGDNGLLKRLRHHSPTIKTIARIRAFMRERQGEAA